MPAAGPGTDRDRRDLPAGVQTQEAGFVMLGGIRFPSVPNPIAPAPRSCRSGWRGNAGEFAIPASSQSWEMGGEGGTVDGERQCIRFRSSSSVLAPVMVAVPVRAISWTEIWAVKVVLLTNVVGRLPPFHRTIDVGRNPAPLTVRVRRSARLQGGDNPVMERWNRGRAKAQAANILCCRKRRAGRDRAVMVRSSTAGLITTCAKGQMIRPPDRCCRLVDRFIAVDCGGAQAGKSG